LRNSWDTGIRVSELCGLRVGDFDRKHGLITVKGKGSKERRIALGTNCLRNLSYYLDKHRPGEEELAAWGSAGEDHLFLSETRQPLTKNGMEMLFKRLKARAGITDCSAWNSDLMPRPLFKLAMGGNPGSRVARVTQCTARGAAPGT
jgi:site-specific recombinase XerD